MAYKKLIVEREGGVVVIQLNNPERMNASDPEMTREFHEELDRTEADSDSRVVVLTGVGNAFSGGYDMNVMKAQGREPEQTVQEHPYWARIDPSARQPLRSHALRFRYFDRPIIAAVNGYAIGGLCLACDIRIASEKAKFCFMYTRRGLSPAEGSSYLLPHLVGISKALELAFTGDMIDGREAARVGLVSKVVPHEELMPATMELAHRIARNPPIAIGLTKYVMYKALQMSIEDSMALQNVAHTASALTEDHKEGVRAYAEKREPRFKGR
jgi:enoyl-CoA hydratase/carnithine racemase